jgi:hypothetical protein
MERYLTGKDFRTMKKRTKIIGMAVLILNLIFTTAAGTPALSIAKPGRPYRNWSIRRTFSLSALFRSAIPRWKVRSTGSGKGWAMMSIFSNDE